MLKTAQFTSYRTPKHSTPCKRASWVDISRTSRIAAEMPARDMRALPNRADAPPRHQMVVLKGLLGGERRWGEFRKVVHTGLYSQIVAMEVDVGGQVGEEVSLALFRRILVEMGWAASSSLVVWCLVFGGGGGGWD